MKKTVFIHTNNKQILGAYVAKYAIESRLKSDLNITVSIINVDELEVFKQFAHTAYTHAPGDERTFDPDDLQSFTLSRFMPPELMGYEGRAIVIDPDIFALCDINELFSLDMKGDAILACKKKSAWDTSVMLLDCAQLRHWKIATILSALKDHTKTYKEIMTLETEKVGVAELSRIWNHLDIYDTTTKVIHMTNRITQPWKTGLPINFTRNKMPKLFGIIPRELIHTLLGKRPTHFQKHPNPEIEQLFFRLAKETLDGGGTTKEVVESEINKGNIRPDLIQELARL